MTTPSRSLPIVSRLVLLCVLGGLASGCHLYRELQELRQINTLNDKRIRELTGEVQSERDERYAVAARTSGEIQSLQAQLDRTERALKRAQAEKADTERALKAQLAGLENRLTAARGELAAARQQGETLSAKAASRTLQVESLEANVKRLEAQLASSRAETRQARIERDERKSEAAQARSALDKAHRDLEDKRQEAARLAKNLDEATEKARRLEGNTKNLSGRIQELQEAARESGATQTEEVEALRAKAAQLQRELDSAKRGEVTIDGDLRDALALFKASLKPLIDADYAQVATDRRGVVVRLAASYLFEQEIVSLDPGVLVTLDQVGEILNRFPKKFVEVQGHTDSQAVMNLPFADNWALASARAGAVARYLAEKAGVSPQRLKMSSCSQYRPLSQKSPSALDRRVEIVLGPMP